MRVAGVGVVEVTIETRVSPTPIDPGRYAAREVEERKKHGVGENKMYSSLVKRNGTI